MLVTTGCSPPASGRVWAVNGCVCCRRGGARHAYAHRGHYSRHAHAERPGCGLCYCLVASCCPAYFMCQRHRTRRSHARGSVSQLHVLVTGALGSLSPALAGSQYLGTCRREGAAHPRAHERGSEALQVPGGKRGAVCGEGGQPRPVLYCTGRVAALQAAWRLGCAAVRFQHAHRVVLRFHLTGSA